MVDVKANAGYRECLILIKTDSLYTKEKHGSNRYIMQQIKIIIKKPSQRNVILQLVIYYFSDVIISQ